MTSPDLTSPDFLDKLISFFQNAIASTQELRAENTQLKAANADLQARFDAVNASLTQDEQGKVDVATKMVSLQQIVEQYEAAVTPTVTPVAA